MKSHNFRTFAVIGAFGVLAAACSDEPTLVQQPPVANPSFAVVNGTDLNPDLINGGLWTPAYNVPTSVGTGVIRPFLDMSVASCAATAGVGADEENGLNTDNDAFVYCQHRTTDTNALPVNWIPRIFVAGFGFGREFVLDAHESDSDLRIDQFEVWLCNTSAATTFSTKIQVTGNSLCRQVYTIANDTINGTDQYSSGSGNTFDYQILIPDTAYQRAATQLGITLCAYNPTNVPGCQQYLVVWSKMADVGSTFEEFSTLLRTPPPELTIVKTPDAQTVNAGSSISFTIVVSNAVGVDTAKNVVVKDTLPGGAGIDWSTATAGCSIAGSPEVLTCNVGTLDPGASFSATVTSSTTGNSCGVYNNRAWFSATEVIPGSDTGQNTVTGCVGTVKIVKVAVGGDSIFNYTGSGGNPIPATFNLTTSAGKDSVTYSNVPVGQYHVIEGGPYGSWAFTSLSCSGNGPNGGISGQDATIDVTLGATVRCVFTNTKQAELRVAKVTEPDGDATDFTFTPYGWNSGSTFTRRDNQAAFSSGVLAPGAYAVEESAAAGYSLTTRACVLTSGPGAVSYTTPNGDSIAVSLSAGQVVTCTFTNAQQGQLRIVKETIPDADATDFTFTPYGWNGGSTFTRRDNQAAFSSGYLPAGSYSVEETAVAGYALTARSCVLTSGPGSVSYTTPNSDSVSVALALGQVVTCTFTNTAQARLRIKKQTVPDGDLQQFQFTKSGNWSGTFQLADGDSLVSAYLTPNQAYGASETIPVDWFLRTGTAGRNCVNTVGGSAHAFTTPGDGVSVTLAPGEDVTCTFTNEELGTLIVQKEIPGTSAQTFDFTRSTMPAGVAGSFNLGDGQSSSTGRTLHAGSYQVCEVVQAGWADPTASIDGGASQNGVYNLVDSFCWSNIAVAAGDTTIVIVTNTPPPGTTRTIGYWKNWSSCTGGRQWQRALALSNYDKTLDGNLPQTLGALVLDQATAGPDGQAADCLQAVYILGKSAIDGTKRPGDPIYNMAAQLLGALLNIQAGSGSCQAATDAISGAQALLTAIGFDGLKYYSGKNANYTLTPQQVIDANNYAGILDQFNNGTLGGSCPTHF